MSNGETPERASAPARPSVAKLPIWWRSPSVTATSASTMVDGWERCSIGSPLKQRVLDPFGGRGRLLLGLLWQAVGYKAMGG
jgi:hypothetical protein